MLIPASASWKNHPGSKNQHKCAAASIFELFPAPGCFNQRTASSGKPRFPRSAEVTTAARTAHIASEYGTTSGVTYQTASNMDLKLDVYAPRGLAKANPVVIYYHSGGWAGGVREHAVLRLTPYLEVGSRW